MNAKGSTGVWLVVLMLVLGLAGLGGLWFWRKQRAAGAAERQRWEVTVALQLPPGLSDIEIADKLKAENERLDQYLVLRPVVDELDLVSFWGVAGPDEALERLKECTGFREGKEPGGVVYVASDKDKDMAAKIGGAVWKSYESMQRMEQALPTELPASE